ncbi:MAG: CvpA family protein [Planctomycetaceae bacterium]|jgi:hypothetical protein|nr:CvpA family protein [Planctomycetaceae bacterium]
MKDALIGIDANKAIFAAAWLAVIFRNLAVIGFFGYRWKEGLWGNILVAFNMMFSTIFTLNYWEVAAKMLAKSVPAGLFFWDAVAFAVLFIVTFIILTIITDKLSRVVVAFPPLVERIGNGLVLGFITGMMILPLYFVFLEISPVAPIPVASAREKKETDRAERVGFYPEDVFFYGPYRFMSSGSLSCLKGTNSFDPDKDFVVRHTCRRCMMFKNLWEKGKSAYTPTAEKPLSFLD